jgi:formyltetrahydrofolate synthetase
MNDKEYEMLQKKIEESGRTQQAVVIAAIENVTIASASEVMSLQALNKTLEEMNRLLRGMGTNINQIARATNAGGYSRMDVLKQMSERITGYRRECERIWQLIRQLTSGQIHTGQ